MNNLSEFLAKESASYVRMTGESLPPIDETTLTILLGQPQEVIRYCATRLHYYGGGENKVESVLAWAHEAINNPCVLE